jgi:nitroimidazol reductase NimA-like FMN-containing flavoprotein (pyridoxamine 5'-phosphate oxidase superfamily)
MARASQLTELTRQQALRLLANGVIGRVVFVDAAMPAVQPVNYMLDNGEIIFRTANGAKLAAALRQSVVAFEVDEIDLRTRTGWSVVCLGQAYEITDPDRLAALREKMPEPWVEDHTTHTIAIPLHTITGRRLAVHNGINFDLFVRPHGAR